MQIELLSVQKILIGIDLTSWPDRRPSALSSSEYLDHRTSYRVLGYHKNISMTICVPIFIVINRTVLDKIILYVDS